MNYSTVKTECELIKTALCGGEPDLPTEVDWEAVYREMTEQTVFVLPLQWILEHPLPDKALQQKWTMMAARQQAIGAHLLKIQEETFRLMEEHGIPAVVLKGSAAGSCYPNPAYRMKGDIDMLVSPEQQARAAELLEANGYERKERSAEHHINFTREHVSLELHRSMSSNAVCEDRAYLQEILMRGLASGEWAEESGRRFRMMPAAENGIVLLMHAIQHMPTGLGLRQVVDWMLYVERHLDDDAWEAFRPMVERLGTKHFACVLTRMCQRYLGLDPAITWCRGSASTGLTGADSPAAAIDAAAEELFLYVCDQGNFGHKITEKDRVVRFLSAVRTPAALFKRLQDGGMSQWDFARKHRAARPFAWIYQAGRITGVMIREHHLPDLGKDAKASTARNEMFKRVGLKKM